MLIMSRKVGMYPKGYLATGLEEEVQTPTRYYQQLQKTSSDEHIALTPQRERFPSHLPWSPLYILQEEGKTDERNDGEVREERDVISGAPHSFQSSVCLVFLFPQ